MPLSPEAQQWDSLRSDYPGLVSPALQSQIDTTNPRSVIVRCDGQEKDYKFHEEGRDTTIVGIALTSLSRASGGTMYHHVLSTIPDERKFI